jgi:hypothetical protein
MSSTHLTTPRHQLQPVLGESSRYFAHPPFGDVKDRKVIQVPLYRFPIDVSWQTSLEVEHGWCNHCLHTTACAYHSLIRPTCHIPSTAKSSHTFWNAPKMRSTHHRFPLVCVVHWEGRWRRRWLAHCCKRLSRMHGQNNVPPPFWRVCDAATQ